MNFSFAREMEEINWSLFGCTSPPARQFICAAAGGAPRWGQGQSHSDVDAAEQAVALRAAWPWHSSSLALGGCSLGCQRGESWKSSQGGEGCTLLVVLGLCFALSGEEEIKR